MKRSGRIVGMGCFSRQKTGERVFRKILNGYFPEIAEENYPDLRERVSAKALPPLLERLTAAHSREAIAGNPYPSGEIKGVFIAAEGRQLNLAVLSRACGDQGQVLERFCCTRERLAARACLRAVR